MPRLDKKVRKDVERLARHARDVAKIADELDDELKRAIDKARETRERVTKEVGRAVHNIADAAEAVARFAEREARASRDGAIMAIRARSLRSAWDAATKPVKSTNENAMRAMRESSLLVTVGSVAAAVYGGPAGSAAFTAWMAYNASGGDLTVALRFGVTQGLMAYASAGAAQLSAAGQVATDTLLKVAKAQLEGANSEETLDTAMAGLVRAVSSNVSAADFDAVQEALIVGAANGLAVAATGGNHQAIKDAILNSGGKILVQSAQAATRDLRAAVEDEMLAASVSIVDPATVKAVTDAYDELEAKRAEIEEQLKAAKGALDAYIEPSKAAVAEVTAVIAELEDLIDASIAAIETVTNAAKTEMAPIEKTRDEAVGKILDEFDRIVDVGSNVRRSTQAEVDRVMAEADALLLPIQQRIAKQIVDFDAEIDQSEVKLQAYKAQLVDGALAEQTAANVRLVGDELAFSWVGGAAASTGLSVAITLAGAGSEIERQVNQLVDTEHYSEKLLSK